MPQPLSRFAPNLSVVFGSGLAPHDPQMASAVLNVISLWSQIEYNYSGILSRISKAEAVPIAAMFYAVVSGEARQAALFAAAKERLTPEQSSLVMGVIDTFKASRATRNSFAHHLWGSIPRRPDCVVLVHPKTFAKATAGFTEWSLKYPSGITFPADNPPDPPPQLDKSEVMVWQQKDFDHEVMAARVAYDRIVMLGFTVHDSPSADPMRRALLADPQIERRYKLRLLENSPQPHAKPRDKKPPP
jgi:hypothetical protein